jgi:CTP:molybdopterin cytidylyltransferase MocA
MRLLVLMAGDSEAFAAAGHTYPKNLVEIEGLPLVQRVVEGLAAVIAHSTEATVLVRETENRRFHTGDIVSLLAPHATVLAVPDLASGAACTALLAIEHIERDEPLLVVNGDQVVDADLLAILDDFDRRRLDGGIVTFDGVHPRWSYVRCDDDGLVVEATEKRPISRQATAGTYWFRRGGDFVDGAMAMIRKDAAVDGRFYVCPVYNELILSGRRIGTCHIERDRYHTLSSPQAVALYAEHLAEQRRAVAA